MDWLGYLLFFIFLMVCALLFFIDRKEERKYRRPYRPIERVDMVLPMMLDEGAVRPTRAHEDDAGLDLYAKRPSIVGAGEYKLFDTGVHIEIPKGYVGLILSKSGLMTKKEVTATGGVIDAGYTGSIMVQLYNHGREPFPVQKGQKITQLVVVPCKTPKLLEMESLGETDRGANGFGSSGDYSYR